MRAITVLAALAALAALALPGTALAANGSISGTVTNTAHAGIEGVTVCAWGSGPTDEPCDVTSATGHYSIVALAPGEYEVEFWPGTLNYVTQWYHGKSASEAPDGVPVSSGVDTPGIDAELLPGGEIKGKVVSDAAGSPALEGIPVIAFNMTEGETREAETDAGGEYAIRGVSAGTFKVEFFDFAGDYVTQYWNDEPFFEDADTFVLATQGVKTGVDAEMKQAGFISGRLTDSVSGAPLNHIEVCAQDPVNAEFLSCAESGLNGEYKLGHLPEGPAVVVFAPEFFGPGEENPSGYLTQFYNGKSTFAEANPVNVAEGTPTPNIDARLVSLKPPRKPAVVVPLAPPLSLPPVTQKPRVGKCKKGFHRKTVKGKSRCMKVHRKHHHKKHGR